MVNALLLIISVLLIQSIIIGWVEYKFSRQRRQRKRSKKKE